MKLEMSAKTTYLLFTLWPLSHFWKFCLELSSLQQEIIYGDSEILEVQKKILKPRMVACSNKQWYTHTVENFAPIGKNEKALYRLIQAYADSLFLSEKIEV